MSVRWWAAGYLCVGGGIGRGHGTHRIDLYYRDGILFLFALGLRLIGRVAGELFYWRVKVEV